MAHFVQTFSGMLRTIFFLIPILACSNLYGGSNLIKRPLFFNAGFFFEATLVNEVADPQNNEIYFEECQIKHRFHEDSRDSEVGFIEFSRRYWQKFQAGTFSANLEDYVIVQNDNFEDSCKIIGDKMFLRDFDIDQFNKIFVDILGTELAKKEAQKSDIIRGVLDISFILANAYFAGKNFYEARRQLRHRKMRNAIKRAHLGLFFTVLFGITVDALLIYKFHEVKIPPIESILMGDESIKLDDYGEYANFAFYILSETFVKASRSYNLATST